MKYLVSALLMIAASANAQQVLQGVKLSSCNGVACSLLSTPELHRSTLSPNIMAFGDVTLELLTPNAPRKSLQTFRARDGYYDLEEQVIALRELQNSKVKELIYNLSTNTLTYF